MRHGKDDYELPRRRKPRTKKETTKPALETLDQFMPKDSGSSPSSSELNENGALPGPKPKPEPDTS